MAYQYFKRPDGAIVALVAPDGQPLDAPPAWKPVSEVEWRAVPTHYFRTPAGWVLDISERLGGNPYLYLDSGSVEISKAEFEAALSLQMARQEEQRQRWIEESIEDGRDLAQDFAKVADNLAKAEKAAPHLVRPS